MAVGGGVEVWTSLAGWGASDGGRKGYIWVEAQSNKLRAVEVRLRAHACMHL